MKEEGFKVVGHTGSYIPEELIYAGGAVPQPLCRGGDPEPTEAGLSYVPRIVTPFARAQFGYHVLGMDPIYQLPDILVAQCGDCHMAVLADLFEFFTKMPVLKIGVPKDRGRPIAAKYYLKGLKKLREKLEKLTGNQVTDDKIWEYASLYNKMRTLMREISLLRKNQSPPISGYDFIRLNHFSFYCDIHTMISKLESLYQELKTSGKSHPEETPRILLLGHVVAVGDYIIPRSIEENGAIIAAEQFDEGIRQYWWNVKTNGDPMENLAQRYWQDRLPSSVQQPSWEERLEFFENIVKDFEIDGVIWYHLKFDEIYGMESYVVGKRMKKIDIPMLTLESSYEPSEATGRLITRIESFIEAIKERKGR